MERAGGREAAWGQELRSSRKLPAGVHEGPVACPSLLLGGLSSPSSRGQDRDGPTLAAAFGGHLRGERPTLEPLLCSVLCSHQLLTRRRAEGTLTPQGSPVIYFNSPGS